MDYLVMLLISMKTRFSHKVSLICIITSHTEYVADYLWWCFE